MILNNSHEVHEVIVLEVLELPLVVCSLVKISLADALHNLDAAIQTGNSLLEVVAEAKVVRVLLDFLESLKLQLCALKGEFDVDNILLELLKLQVDSGSVAEVD